MLSGSVFLDRKNNKSAVQMMNAAGDEMKRKGVSRAMNFRLSEAHNRSPSSCSQKAHGI